MEFLKSGVLRRKGHAPPNANSKAQPDTTPNGDSSESILKTPPNDISKSTPKSASSAPKKKASKREALPDEKKIPYQKKHLAVRTIVRALAHIEERRSFPPCINMLEDVPSLSPTWSSSELLEFEIGSAFAHLMLPEHDVIAVTTTNSSAYQDEKESVAARLGVLACTSARSLPKYTKSSDVVEEKCQSPIGSSSKLEPTSHYFVHAEAPRVESSAKRTDVSEYLPHIIRQRRQVPELKVHLWILGQLLTTIHMRSRRLYLPHEKYPTSRGLLYQYILCYTRKKIGSRLKAEKSLRLLDSLRKIQHFSFSIPRPATPSSNPSSDPSDTASHHPQYSDSEIDNDHHFLQHVKRFKSKLTPLEISEIMKVAKETPLTTRDFEFYSERTCHEFHRLLVNLLDQFSEAVAAVAEPPNSEGLPPNESAAVGKSFGKDVKRAHILAYALTKLAKSRAFRMHMQNIEPLLEDAFKPATPRTSSPTPLYDNSERSVDTELDEIFDDRGPNRSNLVLSQVYVKWLQLLVSPFAACDFLVHYVTWEHFKFTGVSIKLLVTPQPSQKTLPWPELFADSRLFPSESPTSGDISDSVTNEDINVFFKERFEKAKLNQLLCDTSRDARELWNRDRTKSAGLQETLTTLLANVENLEDGDRLKGDVRSVQLLLLENDFTTEAPNANAKVCQEVDALLTTIASRCRDRLPPKHSFYLEFGKQGDFSCTLHSEVYLASVLQTFTQHRTNIGGLEPDVDIEQLKGYCQIVGTTRPCWPICHRYLDSIAKHSTISDQDKAASFIRPVFIANCFPGWAPDEVLDDVISKCGGEVRSFLVSLMAKDKPQVLLKPTLSWLRFFKGKDMLNTAGVGRR